MTPPSTLAAAAAAGTTLIDPLLAELNGDLPPLAPGEIAPVPAPSRDEQLTVARAPIPSQTKAADAVHATKAGGKGWRVVVKGEYLALAAGGRGKVKRDYEAEFVLPNLDAALSIIKNKLLDSALRKKYPDFVAARTNKIVDARPLSPETPASRNLQYMNRAQLEAHVQEIRAPISIQDYPDVTDLRDAVIDYTQTPKGFAEREALRQKDRAEDRELRALNPEIELNTGA